jgi:hypothetical protein
MLKQKMSGSRRFLARQALVPFVAALALAVIWVSSDGNRWR